MIKIAGLRLPMTVPFLSLAAIACCIAVLAAPAQAAEEETHIFNATLSLTGGCTTSALDEVPDPGCPAGEHPPAGAFSNAGAVATDSYGDIYVSSFPAETEGEAARVDIFDAQGEFLSEIPQPGVSRLAVDSSGHLYVFEAGATNKMLRFDPTVYNPEKHEIAYAAAPIEIPPSCFSGDQKATHWGFFASVAVDDANQHLFIDCANEVDELGPAKPGEPNEELATHIGYGTLIRSSFLTVDAMHNRLYVAGKLEQNTNTPLVRVYEASFPHTLLETIDGSTTPNKKFLSPEGNMSVAVNEKNGHLFVDDSFTAHKLYEFEDDGSYVWTYTHGLEGLEKQIAFDNGANSPNQSFLFVPSGGNTPSHVYAFEPLPEPEPPVVESVSVDGVGAADAVLHAKVNPTGAPTHYVFEYVTQQHFVDEGFAGASVAGEGDIPLGSEGVAVSAAVTGLESSRQYRFRVVASNECEPGGCSDEGQGTFTTFPAPSGAEGCPNEALRVGPSGLLPDCRAYELVTPVNTTGRTPYAPLSEISLAGPFGDPTVAATGEELVFTINGGVVAGTEGNGANGDAYRASRTHDGWQVLSSGPTGEEAAVPSQGGVSPDQRYMVWSAGSHGGSLPELDGAAEYLHYPDGSFHLIGEGSLGVDGTAMPVYVAAGASHVVFEAAHTQLEPEAAPSGTTALYDRTPDGVTHVISLLPGDVALEARQNASFRGVSDNGASVAFTVETSPIYVRVDDRETLVASPAGATFAGFSTDGRYLFYVSGGDLYRFDSQGGESIRVTTTGDARPVVVSAGGTVYFLSRTALGVEANPHGAEPQAGKENLYYWDGTTVRFVATVTEGDAKGEAPDIEYAWNGLELWAQALSRRSFATVPARTSATGNVLVFQSHADLASAQSGGADEVYRYDATGGTLDCVSCSPSGEAGSGGATLESLTIPSLNGVIPTNPFSYVANLSADGRRAFFESSQRLVPSDNDGVQDVYEWEADGTGRCRTVGGCVFLISSGRGSEPSFLFGVSESGNDVFIETADLLTTVDTDETPSIYDVRVEGGFAEPPPIAGECLGEACQPNPAAPLDATPASAAFQGNGNVLAPEAALHCSKAQRLVRAGGKQRCITVRKKKRPPRHKKRAHHKHKRGSKSNTNWRTH